MMNPILRREAVTTMRSWKTYGTLVLFLAITALGAGLFVYMNVQVGYDYGFIPENTLWLYTVLAAVQMGLVLLVVPAVAAGSISGERERQTLDLLLVTKMSPLSIVLGKLMSSLAYIALLVVATLPIFAIAFYFGGISIGHVLGLLGLVFLTACMVGAVSIFFSCLVKKTVVAIVLMYLVIGVLCFGTLLLLMFYIMYYDMNGINPQDFPLLGSILILIPNPGVAFFSIIDGQLGTNMVAGSVLRFVHNQSHILQWMGTHIWLLHILFDGIMTVIFVLLSAHCINPVREEKAKRKRGKKV